MATAEDTIEFRVKTVIARVASGDKCIKEAEGKLDAAVEKANDMFISAGKYLAGLKRDKPKETPWPAFCEQHFQWGARRCDELIAIGEGRTTLKKLREEKLASVRKSREKASTTRSADQKKKSAPGCGAETDPTASSFTPKQWRKEFLKTAHEAHEQVQRLRKIMPDVIMVWDAELQGALEAVRDAWCDLMPVRTVEAEAA